MCSLGGVCHHVRVNGTGSGWRTAAVAALAAAVMVACGAPAPAPAPVVDQVRVNCAAVPSRCGYPDATNTGVPAGSTLVKVPSQRSFAPGWEWSSVYGAIVTTGPGAVMNGLDVDGGVQIMHPNATLSNSRVTACGGADDGDVVGIRYNTTGYSGSNATVVHNTLNGSPAGCDHRARSGIRDVFGEAPGVTATANDISGTGNGITLEYEGVAADNWIHDLGHIAGDHHSGLSDHGGAKLVVYRHNTVLIYNTPVPGGGGVSAALTVYADFGPAQNTVLDDNLISGGAYTIFAGSNADDPPATNVKVTNNRLVCGDWDYGPVAFYSPLNGNQFTGNYCDQDLSSITPS